MPTPIGHLLFQLEGLVEQNQDPQQQQQPTERGLPAEPPPSTTAFYGRFYRRCDAGTLPKDRALACAGRSASANELGPTALGV